MASAEEAKLQAFLLWLEANKVELRGCRIQYSGPNKGFGVFASNDVSDGVLLVVPLDLAITPMRVLRDPLIGPECRAMFQEGEVDDRFLIIVYLMFERLRANSSWKPYLDILPSTFGNPLWFTDDELLELKGTTLYRATELQKNKLMSLYDDKVKGLMKKLLVLDGNSESEVCFDDFLWGNSLFWSRALNIPLPRSYVFPQVEEDQGTQSSTNESELCFNGVKVDGAHSQANEAISTSGQEETLWVEGLIPGIDFCNHDLKADATWEVDRTGLVSGVPFSMYLLSAGQATKQTEREIFINYGNKGNEELFYLYGFVMANNTDDFLMVHYPVEAIQNDPFFESKRQLLEAQKAELRCLLPKSLLNQGLFPVKNDGNNKCRTEQVCNYSWSGLRKIPSYINKLVFPEDFLTALRTLAMREDELYKVSSLLEELVGSEGDRIPTDSEVRTAVWEACGDSGALQLLVDLLQTKLLNLEEGSGTEDRDSELLEMVQCAESLEHLGVQENESSNHPESNVTGQPPFMSKRKWACIVYRRGQKELTKSFLREAEHALQLSLSEGN